LKKCQDFVNHHQKLTRSMKLLTWREEFIVHPRQGARSKRSYDLQSRQILPSRNAPNLTL